MPETETGLFRRLASRTRKAPLATAVAATGLLYGLGNSRKLPAWQPPFDLSEHARHPLAGVAIAYIGSLASYELGYSSVPERTAAGLGLTGLVAVAVELGVFGRNNPGFADIAYTLAGGAIGTMCVKPTS